MIRSRAQYDAMTFDEVVADIKESCSQDSLDRKLLQ
jgi:hypothetical protein